jgi:D-sedoheptulose 7-phosphate isomerase
MHNAEKFESRIINLVKASMATKNAIIENPVLVRQIAAISELIIAAFNRSNKVVLFGNGGSAADAQHIAAEFVGRFAFDRPALPALALSVNSSSVTAIGNDYGFERVFSRQIEAIGRHGDVAIGITTSGNSPNVLEAMTVAKRIGLTTVGLTGASGGRLAQCADYCVCVPSDITPRIQECHILVGHIISELVEHEIFRGQASSPGS